MPLIKIIPNKRIGIVKIWPIVIQSKAIKPRFSSGSLKNSTKNLEAP